MPWTACVITLFPEIFPGPLGVSLAGRGLETGIWQLDTHHLRQFALDKHGTIDGKPAGGGPGMVLSAEAAARALDHTRQLHPDLPLICPAARGVPFTHSRAQTLANGPGALFLCTRFEGIDQRVIERYDLEELSVGDYILNGGETAALIMLEASIRLLPGIMGKAISASDESYVNGLLEYPHYTRPKDWRGMAIPAVLQSGHHERIARWRQQQAEQLTRQRRPDLWRKYQSRTRTRQDD